MNIKSISLHCLGAGSLTIAGILSATIPVFATGKVSQTAYTVDAPVISKAQDNITVSSLSPSIIPETKNLDAAFSAITLNGLAGYGTLNVHSCSGPPIGATGLGRASGYGTLQYDDSFRITSSTLAIGTLVDITLIADVSLRDTLSFKTTPSRQSFGPNDAAQITGTAAIGFNVGNPLTQYRFDGDFFRTNQYLDGEQKRKTGIFNTPETQSALSLTSGNSIQRVIQGRVGDKIDLFATASLVGNSYASVGVVSEVDAQMSLRWGLHSDNNTIQFVSLTGGNAPDNSKITIPDLIAGLPDRPSTLPPGITAVPEPFTIVGTLLGGATALQMRKRLKVTNKL
jgi:hypothetical protein